MMSDLEYVKKNWKELVFASGDYTVTNGGHSQCQPAYSLIEYNGKQYYIDFTFDYGWAEHELDRVVEVSTTRAVTTSQLLIEYLSTEGTVLLRKEV